MQQLQTNLLFAVLGAVVPVSVTAQAIITLEGVVRHEGAGVASAQISAVQLTTNERRTGITGPSGYFRILDLSPGRYELSVRAIGYTPARQIVQLGVGERAHLEVTLARGATLLEAVAVEEHAPSPEVRRISVATPVSEEEIRHLPLNSRNVMDLAAIVPGIRAFRSAGGTSLPSAGALRDERFINLYVDGMEMKNLYDGNLVGFPQTGSPLPVDGLQEFRVLINPYDAEYARGAAYIISAVTNRGTNQRYGSAHAFYQNRHFVSSNDFQRSIPNFETPDFRRRQIGGSFRGPVVPDRLFYALSFEISDTDNFIAVVPPRPAVDPSFWDSEAGVFRAPNVNNTGVLRLTYATGDATSLDAMWTSRRLLGEWLFGGMVARSGAVVQDYRVNTLNLRHRWLPATAFANELNIQFVGWSHRERPLIPGPELRYPGFALGRNGSAFLVDERQFRLIERATWSVGSGPRSHLLKSGFELGSVSLDHHAGINHYGRFDFLDINTEPHQAAIAVGFNDPDSDRDALAGVDGWIVGGYINDEWRVSPRLVLSVGVRYDAELNTLNNDFTVPWAEDTVLSLRPELSGLLNRGDRRNDLDNISPRASFSWDVGGKGRTFLRGGWGIIHDRVPAFTALQEKRAATWRIYVFSNPGTTDPDELRNRVVTGNAAEAPPSITLLPRKMEAPENRQWSLGLGIQLTPHLSLNTDYIRQDVRKLFASVNLNWLDRSEPPPRRVLSNSYGNIVAWGDFARARYDGLLTRLSYTRGSSLWLHLAHTLGFARAEWDVANVSVPAAAAADFYVMQRTSGDERHRFVLSGMGTLPFGLGISAIATVASPRPYLATVGQDLNRNDFRADDWIDGRRYQLPSGSWRNWYRVVDLRLTQPVQVGRARLALMAEAFNLFNAQNYSGYFSTLRNSSGELEPQFGMPSDVFATRQMQLGTRLEF